MNFRRRDGPRVFLDSRDLINEVEHDRPLPLNEFRRLLCEKRARIVLTHTTVTEFLPRRGDQTIDRTRALELVARLESLPLAFIREPDLIYREFLEAREAYFLQRVPRKVDMFVDQWWQTFSKTPAQYMRFVNPSLFGELKRMTLVDEVRKLIDAGLHLHLSEAEVDYVARRVEDDRKYYGRGRGTKRTFAGAIEGIFEHYGWPEPIGGFASFVDFVRREHIACPAWRLGLAVYEEFRADAAVVFKAGDIPDRWHVHVLPYVTHATLDKAWRTRCDQARTRLMKNGENASDLQKVYSDTAAIVAVL